MLDTEKTEEQLIVELAAARHHIAELESAASAVCDPLDARCSSPYESLVRLYELEIDSLQELFDFALEEALVLTKSLIGYIYFYDERTKIFTLYSWSKNVMNECKIMEKQTTYYLEKTGIWGETVRQRRPIVVNNFSEPNPLKKGYPEGHVALHKYLTLPIWQGDNIVAVIGVANRQDEYTVFDVSQLDLFAKGVWVIAQRKKVEEALKESEAKYRAFFQSSVDGILLASPDGRIHQANAAVCRMLGWSEEEICQGGRNLLLDESDPMTKAFIQKRNIEGNSSCELVHRCKGGSKIITQTTSSTYIDHRGDQKSCVILHDVTDRKRIEVSLHASEQRFRAIFDSSPIGIAVVDSSTGRFLQINHTFSKMLGLPPGEMLQKDFMEMTHPDDLQKGLDNMSALTKGQVGTFTIEKRYIHIDGGIVWVKLIVVPLWEKNEPQNLHLAIVTNITERKRSEQLRDDVESIIRHDIKAPLIALFNLAQLAKRGKLDVSLVELFPQIDRGIRQIIHLLDASGPLRKMEDGEYCPNIKPFQVFQFFSNVKDLLVQEARKRNITILLPTTDDIASAGEPLLYGEEFLVENVLINLLKNAIEASPAGCNVIISYKVNRNEQHIIIHNMGVVPELVRDRFFDKYSSAGKRYGTGLGTYSAQLIAKAHGGRIEFSTSEENGTTVEVILPRYLPKDL